jgi:hypothetical protein
MIISRSVAEPIRQYSDWDAQWAGPDRGLIACWERGREKAKENPDLAKRACSGQLVVLPFKGGAARAIKAEQKFGTHFYLAMWQGLRGEDLNLDMDGEYALTCTVTGLTVVFTGDPAKYANA